MVEKTDAFRRLQALAMVAGAVLALAGCAAPHVGEDWQCPLVQGTQCASVAAADPAVKPAGSAEWPAGPAPLYRVDDAARPVEDAGSECDRGCDPFAWLGRLFVGSASGNGDSADDAGDSERPVDTAPEAGVRAGADAARGPGADAARGPGGDAARGPGGDAEASAGDTSGEPLRAPEAIGRIWIAPWVDGDGVYREASWVRIVIAPAAWRRP